MKKFIILALSLGLSVAGNSHLKKAVLRPQGSDRLSHLVMKKAEATETVTKVKATTLYAGGIGGNLFDDGFAAAELETTVCKINYRADDSVIHGIQLILDEGDGSCGIELDYHGGDAGGSAGALTFSKDKPIASASVWLNDDSCVKAIRFYGEDSKELGTIGTATGSATYKVLKLQGNLVGFQGRAAANLDSISFITAVPSSSSNPASVLRASEPYGGDLTKETKLFQNQIPKSKNAAKSLDFYLNDSTDEIVGINIDHTMWYGKSHTDKKCSLDLVNASLISTTYNSNNVIGATVKYNNGTDASCGQVGQDNQKGFTILNEAVNLVGIYGALTADKIVNLGWIIKRVD